jgi:hypothetical protein
MAIGPCQPGMTARQAVPARHCVVPPRAVVPVEPCLAVLRAWLLAQGTAHGPFCRAVPPVGHGHYPCAVPAHGPSVEKHFKIFTSVHHFQFFTSVHFQQVTTQLSVITDHFNRSEHEQEHGNMPTSQITVTEHTTQVII